MRLVPLGVLILALLGVSTHTQAQTLRPEKSASWAEALGGSGLKAVLTLEELDSSYHAIQIITNQGFSFVSHTPWNVVMYNGFHNLASDRQPRSVIESLAVSSWTSDQTLSIGGVKYLVIYTPDFAIPSRLAVGEPPALSLRLQLINTESIDSIEPRPGLTASMLKDVAKSIEQALHGPRLAAQRTSALSNAKQIVVGIIMLLFDSDDRFPYVESTGALQRLLKPYLKNESLWNTLNPAGSRFLFNMALAGVKETSVPDLANTVMLYDSAAWPDGSRIVGFADGHAKRVDERTWSRLKKTLSLKLPRVGKPIKE